MISLQFTKRFEMAHRLLKGNAAPLCASIHGHSWTIITEWSLEHGTSAPGQAADMMVEFANVKGLWHKFVDDHLDHAFAVWNHDPMYVEHKHDGGFFAPSQRWVLCPGNPTTEMLAALLLSKANALTAAVGVYCSAVKLVETPTNAVELKIGSRDEASKLLSLTKGEGPYRPYEAWWNKHGFDSTSIPNGGEWELTPLSGKAMAYAALD